MTKFSLIRFICFLPLIFLTYLQAQPTQVDIAILSKQFVAGDTILAAIRISDNNGLIQGNYCASNVIYQDILNSLPSQARPSIIVDGQTYTVNKRPDTSIIVNQCFLNGIDTVKIVLFNAPNSNDSLHQLFISMGQIKDSTPLFKLLPTNLYKIKIRGFGGEIAPDTVSLVPSVAQIAVSAIGYDSYDNRIGLVSANWSTTGSLPQLKKDSAQLIIVFFGDAQTPAEGYLLARSVLDSSVSDSVWIILNSPAGVRNKSFYPKNSPSIRLSFHDDFLHIDILDILPPIFKISLYDLSGKSLYSAIILQRHIDIKLTSPIASQFLILSFISGNMPIQNHAIFVIDGFNRDAFACHVLRR